MKIGLAGDHAGYCLKDKIREVIEKLGHEPIDFGTGSGEPVDYPDYALILCEAILEKQADMGILCCGTGLGMAISANKVPGIEAVTCSDTFPLVRPGSTMMQTYCAWEQGLWEKVWPVILPAFGLKQNSKAAGTRQE